MAGGTSVLRRGVQAALAAVLLLALVPAAAFAVDVTLSGNVTGPTGTAAVGWTVSLFDADMISVDTTLTDVNGDYSFLVPQDTGQYLVVVTDPDGLYYADRMVTVAADNLVADFDFSPAISGVVTNASGGAPLANVSVAAWYFDAGLGEWTPIAFATTDGTGAYTLPVANLVPGVDTYTISFDALGFRSEFYNDKTTVATADAVVFSGTPVSGINAGLTAEPIRRVAGANRFSTSTAIADAFVSGDWGGVVDVIIASGEDRAAADPLAAAGLAWTHNNCPILLVSSTSVSPEVKNTIKAMVDANAGTPVAIHVVGGTVSVPDARVNEIKAFVGAANVTVERINGNTRYDVAAMIAEKVKASWANDFGTPMPVPGVLFANGADPSTFFDALAMSAVSAGNGMPILLVKSNGVPAQTSTALTSMGVAPADRFVAGGARTVNDSVLVTLGIPAANRLSGPNRYATARAVADAGLVNGWFTTDFAGIAAKLPDALSGGAMVGALGGPLLLTRSDTLSAETQGYLVAHADQLAQVFVFGGEKSVMPIVLTQITAALN